MKLVSRLRTNSKARAARELIDGVLAFSDTPFKSISRKLDNLQIKSVIDVGANVGQFGIDIRRYGFEGQIISYEPVQKAFNTLSLTAQKYQPWKVFQLGLGADESELSINVSGNAGLSSSILKMGTMHLDNFPDSATVSIEKIKISTIDQQLKILEIKPEEVMLKLDVQGYESEVLKGASQSISKIPLCYLEVSIIPMYEGEITFLPIIMELSRFGHEVIDIFRGTKSKDGQLLQIDILTALVK